MVVAESVEQAASLTQVGSNDHHLRIRLYSEGAPCGEAWIPQHCGRLHTGALQEILGEPEIVLGADTNDLHRVDVVESKLLYIRPFTPAGRSMWCPKPEEHRTVTVDSRSNRGNGSVDHREHFDVSGVIGCLQERLVRIGCI